MNTLKNILSLLADGECHTGEAIGKALNLTRSAVWKALKSLDKYGLSVNSEPRKGYQLPGGFELLDDKKILSYLTPKIRSAVSSVKLFDSIDSTNNYLLANASELTTGTIALAEHQTAGKGRRGRSWISPFGKHIYFSMLWDFNKDPSELSGLSLMVAVAVIRAIKACNISHPLQLKWPNDIWADNKKLGGVLLEMIAEPHGVTRVVVGIGINIDFKATHDNIDVPHIDLQSLTPQRISRNQVIAQLIEQLHSAINDFEANGFQVFQDEWHEYDCTRNKIVTLSSEKDTISGLSVGVNSNGELLLKDNNGNINAYLTGDTSLRL